MTASLQSAYAMYNGMRVEDGAVEVLAATQRLFCFDLCADVADRTCEAYRPTGRIAFRLTAKAAPDRRTAVCLDPAAHIEGVAILEMCAHTTQDKTAIIRMQDVLERLESIRELGFGVADDVAKAFRVPHVSREQIPVVQAVAGAVHGALPATLDLECLGDVLPVLSHVAQHADHTLSATRGVAAHDARACAKPLLFTAGSR